MVTNKNAILLSVGMLFVHNAYSMKELEQQQLQEQPVDWTSSVCGALNVGASYVPSSSSVYNALNAGANYVTSTTSSLTKSLVTTAAIASNNDLAFAKLGFPLDNDVNRAELAKYKAIVERHNRDIINDNSNTINFSNDASYLERRRGFCHRLVDAVATHVKGPELAGFALKHYQPVMNSFEIARLVMFVQFKKAMLEKAEMMVPQSIQASILLGSILQPNNNDQQIHQQGQQGEEEKKEKERYLDDVSTDDEGVTEQINKLHSSAIAFKEKEGWQERK